MIRHNFTVMMKMTLNRRALLQSGALGTGALALGGLQGCQAPPTRFNHGVASGDPTDNRVIIWTRVDVQQATDIPLEWIVARDPSFNQVVLRGKAIARLIHDHCVKVDVKFPAGERPGSEYYYRFVTHDRLSPIGRTRTLPDSSVKNATFAVVSCSNYPAGHFSVYQEIANQPDLNFVLHLGDYIYEYGRDGYGGDLGKKLSREVSPEHEIIALQDYRARYAQYRSDPNLQAAHARHPFIVVWDDHETANNSWRNGAQNHNADKQEGEWNTRRAAGLQAYSEWMPIRLPEPDNLLRIYRDFRVGDLLHLHMLDTRLIGRAQQLEYANYLSEAGGFDGDGFSADLLDPKREMLGLSQQGWLHDNLSNSGATWQILGQQVLMVSLKLPKITDMLASQKNVPSWLKRIEGTALPTNMDAWDGYPVAREKLYASAARTGKSIISLAGDTHNAWASTLRDRKGKVAGVELATPSITSPGIGDVLDLGKNANGLTQRIVQHNRELEYLNISNHGYILVHLTPNQAQGEFRYVDTVLDKNYSTRDDLTRLVSLAPGRGAQLQL